MKDSTFTLDQIAHLREIEKARIKVGLPGLRKELQHLIRSVAPKHIARPSCSHPQLGSEGFTEEFGMKILWGNVYHEAAAMAYWEKGWGKELGLESFQDYLASIPDVPADLIPNDPRFPHIVLVDVRLGLTKTCELLDVVYGGDDQTFEDRDLTLVKTEKVYWIRAQDGSRSDDRFVEYPHCQFNASEGEVGLTALEGLALFAQDPQVLEGRVMNLPGSSARRERIVFPYLYWLKALPSLYWGDVEEVQCCGAASRRV